MVDSRDRKYHNEKKLDGRKRGQEERNGRIMAFQSLNIISHSSIIDDRENLLL